MKVTCPKCGSEQLTAAKKGFSGKKAVAGAVLTGGIGLLAGTIGSNKVICTCLACGNRFPAGQGKVITDGQQTASVTITPLEQAKMNRDAARQQFKEKMNKSSGMKTAAIILWLIVVAFIVGIIIASK